MGQGNLLALGKMLIYKITNVANGKVYVGKTNDLGRRTKDHFRKRRGFIGKAIQKYGVDNFIIETLADNIHDEVELNRLEIAWISVYQSSNDQFGYNLTLGGDGGLLSQEMRMKRSGANAPMFGKKHTQDSRDKMSRSRKGKQPTEKQWESLRKSWALRRGTKLSTEHKARIASAHVGMRASEETKAKLRKPKTEKHRANLRRSFRDRKLTRMIEFAGECHPLAEWARRAGITTEGLRYRLDSEWPLDVALTKPACDGRFRARDEK